MNLRDLLRRESAISNRFIMHLLNKLDFTMESRLVSLNSVVHIQVDVLLVNGDKLLLLRHQHQVALDKMILVDEFWVII
jgi:hypothetical protein